MKYFLTFLVCAILPRVFAQEIIKCDGCNACESCEKQMQQVQQKFLAPYSFTPSQQNAVISNWGEFFFEDLERHLPAKTHNAHALALKFDSFGCIYPAFMDNTWTSFFKINTAIHETQADKNTFYAITYRTKKKKYYNPDAFFKAFPKRYQPLLETLIKNPVETKNQEDIARADFDYIQKWNDIFIPEQIQAIRQAVARRNSNKIVVLIHGYGVPYSLGQIQFNSLIDLYSKELKDSANLDKVLFMKVFWLSGDFKRYKIHQNGLEFANVQNYKVIRHVTYKTTRVFMVGAQLRKILSKLQFEGELQIIGHSPGSVLSAAVMINPVQKLNLATNDTQSTGI